MKKADQIEGELNKWWRKEDHYLHGFRCQLASPGWGESSKRENRKGKAEVSAENCHCCDRRQEAVCQVFQPPCPQTPKKIRIAQLENKPRHLWAAQLMWQCHVDYSVGDSLCTKSIRFQRDGERGRAWWGCKAECMCLETEAVLIKVNPATREERSMQAYWSRPLGCGECLAGKDSLVRSLTLIHWTLIRMALPGLDASVITAFVSRSPPSPNFIFHIFFFHHCCSTWAISPGLVPDLLEETHSWCIWELGFAAKLCSFF